MKYDKEQLGHIVQIPDIHPPLAPLAVKPKHNLPLAGGYEPLGGLPLQLSGVVKMVICARTPGTPEKKSPQEVAGSPMGFLDANRGPLQNHRHVFPTLHCCPNTFSQIPSSSTLCNT